MIFSQSQTVNQLVVGSIPTAGATLTVKSVIYIVHQLGRDLLYCGQ